MTLTVDSPDDPRLQPVDHADTIQPAPERATRDVPAAYAAGCQLGYAERTPKPCHYGDPNGRLTIAVVGDSKAVQWMPALEILARRHGWRLVVHAKSACGFHSRPLRQRNGELYASCTQWNEAVLPLILGADKPDVVFTSLGSGKARVDDEEVQALNERWRLLQQNGIQVVAVANNPNPGRNVYECVAENRHNLTKCAFRRGPGSGTPSMEEAAKQTPGVHYVNLNDSICARSRCAAVIGDVLVYRQGSHITRTYAASLANRLEKALAPTGLLASPPSPGKMSTSISGREKHDSPILARTVLAPLAPETLLNPMESINP